MKTYYYTRDALSNGGKPIVLQGEPWVSLDGKVREGYVDFLHHRQLGHLGKNTFETQAQAVAQIEKMKAKRIAVLRKEIARIEAIK